MSPGEFLNWLRASSSGPPPRPVRPCKNHKRNPFHEKEKLLMKVIHSHCSLLDAAILFLEKIKIFRQYPIGSKLGTLRNKKMTSLSLWLFMKKTTNINLQEQDFNSCLLAKFFFPGQNLGVNVGTKPPAFTLDLAMCSWNANVRENGPKRRSTSRVFKTTRILTVGYTMDYLPLPRPLENPFTMFLY